MLGYQDAAAERAITTAVTEEDGQVVDLAVTLTRATREHRDVRMGASVRGAIDLVLLLTGLILRLALQLLDLPLQLLGFPPQHFLLVAFLRKRLRILLLVC